MDHIKNSGKGFPSMNILIKLTSIVALVIAPFIAVDHNGHGESHEEESSAIEIIEDTPQEEVFTDL